MSLDLDLTLTRPDGFRLRVDLELPQRGCTTLHGASGCGKTTLLRCVAGLELTVVGRVALGDRVFQDGERFAPPHERRIGYVFQDGALFPHLTVAGNLEFARARAQGRRHVAADDIVESLDLGPLLSRRIDRLSGGERQRVGLARALASSPSLLLLDEPLGSLDRGARGEILPYLETLVRGLELPVLYVTHDVSEASRLGDHLVVIQAGRVTTHGPLGEVITAPPPGLATGTEAAAVLSAVVDRRHAHDQMATLVYPGGTLLVPDPGLEVGSPVRVRILARDISLTLARAEATSILNSVPATVTARWSDGPSRTMVRLLAGEAVLLAAITHRSAEALKIEPGQSLFAQVKSLALL